MCLVIGMRSLVAYLLAYCLVLALQHVHIPNTQATTTMSLLGA